MSNTLPRSGSPQTGPAVGPTKDEWARMSEAERDRLIDRLEAEYSAWERTTEDPLACGDPHHDAIEEMRSALRTYYGRFGRRVYVGTDVLVLYPGEPPVKPDIIVALDADPAPRDSWVVAHEGKGIDLAIEVHNKGDWSKDFVLNVKTYARLGIPEYFAYAIERRRLVAYQLRASGRSYQPILPQAGRYPSQVLGLDVALEGGRVRFYAGNAQLFPDRELRARLEAAVDEAQARAEQADVRAEQADVRAEQADVRADRAVSRLAESILTILRLRGLAVSDEVQGRIAACGDLELLERWLGRAATSASADEIFSDS